VNVRFDAVNREVEAVDSRLEMKLDCLLKVVNLKFQEMEKQIDDRVD
jgi:hypothetical protein